MEAVLDPKENHAKQSPIERGGSKTKVLLIALGLVGGMTVGYVGAGVQGDREPSRLHSHGTAEAPGASCAQWTAAICDGLGPTAYACNQAKAAGKLLLSHSACAEAHKEVTTRIEQIKAGRGPCTTLSARLCSQLGPDGPGCELVKNKEPTLSVQDCQDMTKNYDQVLAQIMSRQTRGTLPESKAPARSAP